MANFVNMRHKKLKTIPTSKAYNKVTKKELYQQLFEICNEKYGAPKHLVNAFIIGASKQIRHEVQQGKKFIGYEFNNNKK